MMVNEGSTKPTYSELEAEIELLKACNESQAAGTAALWEILAPEYEGDKRISEVAQELVASLARVRGLLQYYVDVTVRRGTYNAKLEKEAQFETEGAESADIGKLDSVEVGNYSCAVCGFGMMEPCEHWKRMAAGAESGVEMGKVNRVDEAKTKCQHCHMPIDVCLGTRWASVVHNRTRLNYRQDDECGAVVIEFPRILTQAKTLEDAIAALTSVVKFQAQLLETGEIQGGSAETGGEKATCAFCRKPLATPPPITITDDDGTWNFCDATCRDAEFESPIGGRRFKLADSREPEKLNNAQNEDEYRGLFASMRLGDIVVTGTEEAVKWAITALSSAYRLGRNERLAVKHKSVALAESSLSSPPPELCCIHGQRQSECKFKACPHSQDKESK